MSADISVKSKYRYIRNYRYFHHWLQELNLLQHFKMTTLEDAMTLAEILECDEVFDFLVGFKPNLMR